MRKLLLHVVLDGRQTYDNLVESPVEIEEQIGIMHVIGFLLARELKRGILEPVGTNLLGEGNGLLRRLQIEFLGQRCNAAVILT